MIIIDLSSLTLNKRNKWEKENLKILFVLKMNRIIIINKKQCFPSIFLDHSLTYFVTIVSDNPVSA